MKKLLFKIITKLVLVIMPVMIAFVLLIQVFPMHYFDKEYAWYRENKEHANKNNEYARILYMGDSLAKTNFMPRYLASDSYNYALGGASIAEEYFYLKEYLENNDSPEYIFYSTDPNRFLIFDTLWTRSVYFHRLDKEDLLALIDKAEEYDNLDEIGRDKIKELNQYYFYLPTKYSAAIMNGILMPSRFNENTNKYNDVIENKGETQFNTAKYCDEINNIAYLTRFEALPVLDYYFEEMLKLCDENNISFIFELAPLNKSTYEVMNQTFIKEYFEYLNDKQIKFPKAKINTEYLCYENNCFGDSAHLNDLGIEKYNKYIKNKYLNIFEGN